MLTGSGGRTAQPAAMASANHPPLLTSILRPSTTTVGVPKPPSPLRTGSVAAAWVAAATA